MVVAHRGASVEQPENTLEAFEAAIDAGADAVEFDVRMTADGVAVVMHDPDVSRTTDGTGLVPELTLADVRRLRIPLPDGGVTGVPTLEEALACLSGRAAADIEIKNLPDEPGFTSDREEAVEATLEALDEVGFPGSVIVSSFNPRSIAHSRALRSDVPTGLLTEYDVDADEALARATAQGHPWVLPFVSKVLDAGEGLADRVHAQGALLGVWIADDPDTARQLFELGADAVATNDPRSIITVRESGRNGRQKQDRLVEDVARLTRSMRRSTNTPWRVIRAWLQERGFQSERCVIAALEPEDGGWICIVLVPDLGVLRVDAMHGPRGDINTQRADTTIGHWEEVDAAHQRMHDAELDAARRLAASES
jgi:glycerophosphoryl diester phosphodiesterase